MALLGRLDWLGRRGCDNHRESSVVSDDAARDAAIIDLINSWLPGPGEKFGSLEYKNFAKSVLTDSKDKQAFADLICQFEQTLFGGDPPYKTAYARDLIEDFMREKLAKKP